VPLPHPHINHAHSNSSSPRACAPPVKMTQVRKLDGTYELMTYDMYDQKEKLGEVKNKKYLVDVVRRQKRLKYEITAAKHVCSVAFPANFQ